MFRLPPNFPDPQFPEFWLFVAVVGLIHVGLFVTLYWWVARYRNPLVIAGGYFLTHTVVAAIVLPFLFAAAGDQAWVLSFCLCCIDLPSFAFFGWIFDQGSRTKGALAYILVGGGMYSIVGFVIGSIALLYRAKPK
jgi:hypothetical protein